MLLLCVRCFEVCGDVSRINGVVFTLVVSFPALIPCHIPLTLSGMIAQTGSGAVLL
jgi:hypothetical protein